MRKEQKAPYDVWVISDLHLQHKNILRHQPKRIEVISLKDDDDIETHDKWIIDMWLKTVKRNDHVYVLGDMILSSQQNSIYILHKLKSTGCKIHLIVGNHDKSTQKMFNMFDSIDLIKVVDFKKNAFPYLDEDLFSKADEFYLHSAKQLNAYFYDTQQMPYKNSQKVRVHRQHLFLLHL